MAAAINNAAVQHVPGQEPTQPGHTHERGRRKRSRAHQPLLQDSSARSLEQEPAMGLSASKVAAGLKSKSKSRSPAKSREPELPALATGQLERHESICQSPTWSPRGSLAARRQAEKDRREQQRQQRREAEEAKKRLKEEEKRQRQASGTDSNAFPTLRPPGRRLTKRPPPPAMETQRMPTALRSSDSRPEQTPQRRRSSSLSSVFRMVTGGRSRSKSRGGETTDDEAYMSDASIQSRSSFIGGVKLRNTQTPSRPKPQIDASMIPRDSADFGTQMRAQMEDISLRNSIDTMVKGSSDKADTSVQNAVGPNEKASLPLQKQSLPLQDAEKAHTDGDTQKHKQQDNNSQPKRRDSVRLASINRMQNLVIPLRSAMKGGREIATARRSQTIPVSGGSDQPTAMPALSGDYVRRSRLRDHARSMAGWQDEMAVEKAVEAAAAQAAYGPQMPPTPEASIDNLSKPGKVSDERSRQQMPAELPGSEPEKTPTSAVTPGDAEQVVWKQPIKANRQAAMARVEGHYDQTTPPKKPPPSDIDTLPSQNKRKGSTSQALKPAQESTTAPAIAENEIPGSMERDGSSGGDSHSSDLTGRSGLQRAPAVMSWKLEKDKNGKVFSSSPRSPTIAASPTSPIKQHVPPEQHPSLMALRGEVHPAFRSPSESALRNTDLNHVEAGSSEELGISIERPFSIVPTPVASPLPGDLISMATPKPVKTPVPVRRHSTPIEAIEEARTGKKGGVMGVGEASAGNAPAFPFPDRHMTLRKPERRDADSNELSKQDSDKDTKGSSGKVTFHTPPESPRYFAQSTSYDAYRRPYSTAKVSPGLGASEVDDDVELPVSVADLGKPNPPFAQGLGGTRSGNRHSRESSSSPRRSGNRSSDGFVYLPFSPAASSSSVHLAGKRGFKIKNPDGTGNLDFAAKVFVICCGCKKWHDIPSSLYRGMSEGMKDGDGQKDGGAASSSTEARQSRSSSHSAERGTSREGKRRRESRRSRNVATVPCCWCKHEMSTLCCEGWTTVCFKHTQHHQVKSSSSKSAGGRSSEKEEQAGQRKSSPRRRTKTSEPSN